MSLKSQINTNKHIQNFGDFQPKKYNKIILDLNGFLWIATDIGLFKFDSKNFYRFSSDTGLPDNEVLDILVDKDNVIWVSTFSNQIAFVKNDTVFTSSNFNKIHWPKFENINTFPKISESKSSGIYSFSYYNNNFYSLSTHSSKEFSIPSNEGIVEVKECGSHDTLMVYTRYHRYLFINGKLKVNQSIDLDNTPFLKPFYVNGDLFEFKYKNGENRISKIHIRENCDEEILKNIELGSPLNILQSIDNSIYLFVSNKIYQYNSFSNGFEFKDSLKEDLQINSIAFDQMQNRIVESAYDGIFIYPKTPSKRYSNVDQVYSGNIKLIQKIDDHYFLYIDKTIYVTDSSLKNPVKLYSSENEVKSIFKNQDNKIIIFYLRDFYIEYDFKSLKLFRSKSFYAAVKQVINLNDSMVGIAASGSSFLYNLKTNRIDTAFYPFRSTCIAHINNEILIGTLSGLFIYHLADHHLSELNELKNLKITCLTKDSVNNSVFIGTATNGIFIYEKGNHLKHFYANNSLISNEITSLKIRNNILILNTNSGLQTFRIHNSLNEPIQETRKFNIASGLNSNSINDAELLNDKLVLGFHEGLISVDLFNDSNSSKTPLTILDLKSNGQTYYNKGELIELHSNENFIKVDFFSLNYLLSSHEYKYRLKGIDTIWRYTNDDYKEYGPLPPGMYEFEVYVTNKEGGKLSDTKFISFSIEPKIYQKRWVQILFILFWFGLFYLYFRRRIALNKAIEKSKRQMIELELQTIRSQINPHFIFNSLSSIQSFINDNKIIESNLFISKFAKLIRLTLEQSKQSSISLKEELEYAQNYLHLEQVRFHDKFDFTIDVQEHIQTESIFLPPLITQLYLENAIMHGLRPLQSKGFLRLRIFNQIHSLIIQIDDNGIGRNEAQKRKDNSKISRGIGINKERIEKYNALNNTNIQIEIIDKFDTFTRSIGTTVNIIIPHDKGSNS